MEIAGESSVFVSGSSNYKPVVVRVKRKASQSPLDAFWLEINERPLKRPLLDFGSLSISDSPKKEQFKPKKVFVQHVETTSSSNDTVVIVQSFVDSMLSVQSLYAPEAKSKGKKRKETFKKDNREDQLLLKAREQHEILAKNARFEQIWKRRNGNKEAICDKVLHEMCQFYDIVRVDSENKPEVTLAQELTTLEDQKLLSSYLPLLREVIPSAAAEIEFDVLAGKNKQEYADDYVYDVYTVKDEMDIEDSSIPAPLVQVEDEDFSDGPDESDDESFDSNAEKCPLNDYPDEDDLDESEDPGDDSEDESEEHESNSASSGCKDFKNKNDPLYDQEFDDQSHGPDDNSCDGSADGEDWRFS